MGSIEGFFAAIEAGAADEVRSMVAAESRRSPRRATSTACRRVMRARYRSDRALLDAVLSGDPTIDVFEAASLDDIDRLRELLDGDPSAVTAYSADGFTALHFPAFFGGVESARVLLDRGADVDAHGRGWMTGTPLNSAAAGRHADVARAAARSGGRSERATGERMDAAALGGAQRRRGDGGVAARARRRRRRDERRGRDRALHGGGERERGRDRSRPRRPQRILTAELSRRTRTPARRNRTGCRART